MKTAFLACLIFGVSQVVALPLSATPNSAPQATTAPAASGISDVTRVQPTEEAAKKSAAQHAADLEWDVKKQIELRLIDPLDVDGPKGVVHVSPEHWSHLIGRGKQSFVDVIAEYEKLHFHTDHLDVLEQRTNDRIVGPRPHPFWTAEEMAREKKMRPAFDELVWKSFIVDDKGRRWTFMPGDSLGTHEKDGAVTIVEGVWDRLDADKKSQTLKLMAEYNELYFHIDRVFLHSDRTGNLLGRAGRGVEWYVKD